MEKIIIELEAKTDKTLKEVEKLNKTLTETGESGKKSLKAIDESTKKTANSTGLLSKGFKGVGLALKGLGLGIAVKLVDKLSEAFESNQKIVDIVNIAFETVSIVVKQVTDVFTDVLGKVSDATGGFDALSKVVSGTLSIALNLIAGTIQGVVLGVQKAQLAWEESFFGNGDPKEIKRLNLAITETQEKLLKTGENIKNSGKEIADNFLEAVGEVGSLAGGIAEAVVEVIDKVDIKQANADAKRLVNSKKNFERLAQEQQRLVEQYDLQAEQQRQIRDDESKSIADRIKANEDLGAILIKQNEAEKKTVQARINALQQEANLKGETVELSNEIYELQTEMIAIDAKVAGFQSEQQTNINSLKRENLEITNSQLESESNLGVERKRFNAELVGDELLKLESLKEIDLLFQEKEKLRLQSIIDIANLGTQAKVDAQIALDAFMEESRQTNLTRDIEIAKEETELAKRKIREKGMVVDAISQFADAESGIGRALLIVKQALALQETIMDLKRITFKGIEATGDAAVSTSQNVANSSKIGFPWNLITIAGAIAQGVGIISSVKSAVSKTKAKAGGASASVPNIPTPAMPSLSSSSIASIPPAFNVVGQSNTNQLADAIGGQSKQPTRAYVVSGDVTNAQEMDRNIIQGASI